MPRKGLGADPSSIGIVYENSRDIRAPGLLNPFALSTGRAESPPGKNRSARADDDCAASNSKPPDTRRHVVLSVVLASYPQQL
jgi:hypothetical protein